jgi:hypothetical protein
MSQAALTVVKVSTQIISNIPLTKINIYEVKPHMPALFTSITFLFVGTKSCYRKGV